MDVITRSLVGFAQCCTICIDAADKKSNNVLTNAMDLFGQIDSL